MRWIASTAALGCVAIFAAATAFADESLHRRIDAAIAAAAGGPVSGAASDAAFARRVYLDLIGRIPTADEAKKFIADPAPAKRQGLIDALLASDEHPVHLADVFHVMLMERLGEHPEWNAWLVESFRKDKPWDQMVRDLVSMHLDDDPQRGAGLFLAKRLENYGQNPVDYPALVRDVGRLLLGVDLQCAQCHDHPQITDYKQVDYQGLYAYLAKVTLREGEKFPAVRESPTTEKTDFQSVFVPGKREIGPRLPFGTEVSIPMIESGKEFEVSPDKKANHSVVLKFSPLKHLAESLPRGETPGFARNMANRLWWLMMGRGLVHPLDLHHGDNPASHPKLLDTLSEDFIARRFDVRYMLRELALSDAYQRSTLLPAGDAEAPLTSYRVALEKMLTPEQFARSLVVATGPWPNDKKLADLKSRCVKALGQPPREPETEFAPSVKGALFLSHDKAVLGLLDRAEGNLVDRVLKHSDFAAAADDMFLSVFARQPTGEERGEFETIFKQTGAARETALGNFIWAMLSSTEFAVNH